MRTRSAGPWRGSRTRDVIQFVVLTPGQKEILCRMPRPRAPKLTVGGDVWCVWDTDHVHVFDARQADWSLPDGPAGDRNRRSKKGGAHDG